MADQTSNIARTIQIEGPPALRTLRPAAIAVIANILLILIWGNSIQGHTTGTYLIAGTISITAGLLTFVVFHAALRLIFLGISSWLSQEDRDEPQVAENDWTPRGTDRLLIGAAITANLMNIGIALFRTVQTQGPITIQEFPEILGIITGIIIGTLIATRIYAGRAGQADTR